MSKLVNDSHLIGREGVHAFGKVCHEQGIIFREEAVNDFGIDGEIELTRINDAGKREVTGEILKVQIKSTNSEKSYIKTISESNFEFYARQEDIKYWSMHKCDVLIVLYHKKSDSLFIKKISENDIKIQSLKKKKVPIVFNKNYNLFDKESNIKQLFNEYFKARIDFQISEIFSTNLFKIKNHLKYLYSYETTYSKSDEIYKLSISFPMFVLYNKVIYTFIDVKNYPDFVKNCIIDKSQKTISFNQIILDKSIRNHYIELIKKYIKNFLYSKRIFYNKQYNRFYFGKNNDNDENVSSDRYEKYITRKRKNESPRKVVSYYSYITTKFYKHFAFEIDYLVREDGIFMIVSPKHLFTSDGKETLDAKKITQLTNFLTKSEYNNVAINNVHFIYEILCNKDGKLEIKLENDITLDILPYLKLDSHFSLPYDDRDIRIKAETKTIDNNQIELFANE
ncbi:MAG: DUF4365 domain-containing protein [Chitinophagales bacterium]